MRTAIFSIAAVWVGAVLVNHCSLACPPVKEPVEYLPAGKLGFYTTFPDNVAKQSERLDETRRKFWSNELGSLGEPSLLIRDQLGPAGTIESYRTTRSSMQTLLTIRIEQQRDAAKVTWGRVKRAPVKELSRTKDEANVSPRAPSDCGERNVSLDEWRAFQGCIERADFWSMPTDESGAIIADGDQWLLEGRKLENFHFVVRQAPDLQSEVRGLTGLTACEKMLQQYAGLTP